MVLNLAQRKTVDDGLPLTLNVDGTECVLLRSDIFLRMEVDTGPWTSDEMNILADEAEELIFRSECQFPNLVG